MYYHGWTQAEVAALFHINERTLRRHWHATLHKLHGTLKVADVSSRLALGRQERSLPEP